MDFDDTLSTGAAWPALGAPNMPLINSLIKWKDSGNKTILWTCREGILLNIAVGFCKKYGLIFDAINDNIIETTAFFGSNSRKIYADFYIDDKNKDIEKFILDMEEYK